MKKQIHVRILFLLATVGITIIFFIPPIPQEQSYHLFADDRGLFGIPNTLDVVSNLPFVLVGLLGLCALLRGSARGIVPQVYWHYGIFFFGVLFTGFGSIYYHYDPNNQTLVWDRLPMTVGFMAFFSLLVAEFMSVRAGRILLWPMLSLGLFSVLYWHYTEQLGKGDLRLYLLVQFLPMLLVPYILAFFSSTLTGKRWLWSLVGFYLLAKGFELTDHFWYALTGTISGHTLKHLAAGAATFCMYMAIMRRRVKITETINARTAYT